MIRAIPNQPIGLNASRVNACINADPAECLLIDNTDDSIHVQFIYDACPADNLLGDENFADPGSWDAFNWSVEEGNACTTALGNGTGSGVYITDQTFTPTVGNTYTVQLDVTSMGIFSSRGGIRVFFGGVWIGTVTAPGGYRWTVTAVSGAQLTLVLNEDTRACLGRVAVYDTAIDLTVEFLEDTTPVATYTYTGDPELFNAQDGRITFTVAASDVDVTGCHTMRITDGCDNSVLTSQCMNFGTFDCSIKITACNTVDAIGFMNPWHPEMRVNGTINRPSYILEYGQERLSNGVMNRPFADRKQTWKLAVEQTGEYGHAFLSTLGLYDHVYFDAEEYIVTSEAHEPEYSDVYNSTAGIFIDIAPKVDLARKVRTVVDDGGCSPPPNYLVQFLSLIHI